MDRPKSDVSRLLERVRAGDTSARADVIAAAYPELRRVAHNMMRGERPSHTLQATALVHEAYLRLFHGGSADITSRAAFFALMAAQMRRHLIDHARRRGASKRGSGLRHADLDAVDVGVSQAEEDGEGFFARLDAALAGLAVEHPRVSTIVQLRFFEDLSIEETASRLGLSPGTVKRDFAFGRVWLTRRLGDAASAP